MFSAFVLKLIAIISMVIDHTGAVLFPENMELRIIGRLAFPIFCFLIVEGFTHSRSVPKYLMRLGIFAVVSEIPFNLAFQKSVIHAGSVNVFVTLFLGLLGLYLFDKVSHWKALPEPLAYAAAVLPVALACLAAHKLGSDYGRYGVMLIFIFYLFRDNRTGAMLAFFLCTELRYGLCCISTDKLSEVTVWLSLFESGDKTWYIGGSIQQFCILAAIPIALYSGEKGSGRLKWVFYAFYPVHLLVLWLISIIPG